jgi:hypothetical protein
MKTMKLLFYIRHLPSSSTRHLLHTNSLQQRCLLHTSFPLMNKEKSSEKVDSAPRHGSEEQPHMRIEAKAAAEEKGLYNSTSTVP